MSKLTDHRLLSFDVYGTLIDWETGVLEALHPLLTHDPRQDHQPQHLLARYHHFEQQQQQQTPEMLYSEILATLLPKLTKDLGLSHEPSTEECRAFGESVGQWPAFPDTVEALKRLSKHFKLVVLSNVDRKSFAKTNAGPLGGVKFDGILTAQDIGSYKPDRRNFEYMFRFAEEELGVEKRQILMTAQSQFHDHHVVSKLGIKSAWIVRPGSEMGNVAEKDQVYDWKFDTLGQMADAVEKETSSS